MTRDDQQDPEALLRRGAEIAGVMPPERDAIVAGLHRRDDRRTFAAACAMAGSTDLEQRIIGLDVLGQIGYSSGRPFLAETLPVVLSCLADGRPEVLSSAILALGHLADSRGLAVVTAHAGHPSPQVRVAVAVALPTVAGDPPEQAAIAALIRLTSDPDAQVRDWATMGLNAPCEVDSPAIRQALADRLDDPEGDVAGEALLGLAQRGDPRALAPLLSRLAGSRPGNLIVEAAGALGTPEALPALLRLKNAGWAEDDPRPSVLDQAITACSRDRDFL
jgi:HEAT repeat protein